VELAKHGGLTAYFYIHGRPYEGICVPFGCSAHYLVADPDKFDPRRKPGCIVGYGSESGQYLVLDSEKWMEGTISIYCTRDVQIERHICPMEHMQREEQEIYEYTQLFVDDINAPPSYTDDKGNLRCLKCDLLITDEPVSCIVCKRKGKLDPRKRKHPAGRPLHGCLRSRCPDRINDRNQGEDIARRQLIPDDDDEKEEGGDGDLVAQEPAPPPADVILEEQAVDPFVASMDRVTEMHGQIQAMPFGSPMLGIARVLAAARKRQTKVHTWVEEAMRRQHLE